MARKLRLKRTISGITAAVMMVTAVPTTPAYAESGATSYSFDGYDVEYSVKNEWSDGKTIEVKITNTSNESILNWAFKYDAEGKVNDLWNASVYSADNTSYIIKNDSWNYEIAPAASVLFGYKLTEFSDNNPNSFALCSKRVDKTDGFDVQYNITKEWDTGLQGEIVISNTSDEPLEAWELAFDSTFEINNLWDGRIISSEDGHYVIASEMWTNPIDIGSTKVIGFTGIKKNTDEQSISNYNLSVVVIDSEATTSGTGGNGGNDEPEPTPEPEIDITTDTDGDKLPDVYEDMYGTDKENPDTDGDGLTDYEEITLTGTDPLVYDSVTEGVSDEDADYDDDGLTTREEITLGTDPTQPDTDNDRINDYDEINVWHTDPLVADTDKDGIFDGDEVKIGLDPTNPETFGYPDIEYKSTQHIAEDSVSLSSINNEDNDIFTYSVDVTSNGYVEPYMYARKSCYTSVMQNDFMIGIAPELVYLGEYGIDNIKVSFTVSDEYIEKTKVPEETKEEFLSKINIFRYFESANALLPVETTRDAETGTLSTESDAVTTYCLMNMDAWVNMLKEYEGEQTEPVEEKSVKATKKASKNQTTKIEDELDYFDDADEIIADSSEQSPTIRAAAPALYTASTSKASPTLPNKKPIDVMFILQSAGTYENYFDEQKEVIRKISENLFSYSSNVTISILDYKYRSPKMEILWWHNISDVEKRLNEINYTYETNYCNRSAAFDSITKTTFRKNANKFIMHFVNGRTTNSGLKDHIDLCKNNQINVSELNPPGWKYTRADSQEKISKAIKETGGLFETYYASDWNKYYWHIVSNSLEKDTETKYGALVPTGWKKIVLTSPIIRYGKNDTDYDGLSDWDEINNDLLKYDYNGRIQQITIEDFYNEVDRLSLDRIYYQYPYLDVWFKGVTCIPLISDPTNPDGDGDGIKDEDEFKWNGIDEKYKNVSPLKTDTIETIYSELSLSYTNGNNSTENAVYFDITQNDITIYSRVKFYRDYYKSIPLSTNGIAMKDAFISGVEEYWSGIKTGTIYDFYPGMELNINTKIIEVSTSEKRHINVELLENCGISSYVSCGGSLLAGGDWKTHNRKKIIVIPYGHWSIKHMFNTLAKDCDDYINFYNTKGQTYVLEWYKFTCAHEFGHILGIWDAYSSQNNNYQIMQSSVTPKEIFDDDIMLDIFDNINLNDKQHSTSGNVIEMALQAYIDNDWQYYCGISHSLSQSLKSSQIDYIHYLSGGQMEYKQWDKYSGQMI